MASLTHFWRQKKLLLVDENPQWFLPSSKPFLVASLLLKFWIPTATQARFKLLLCKQQKCDASVLVRLEFFSGKTVKKRPGKIKPARQKSSQAGKVGISLLGLHRFSIGTRLAQYCDWLTVVSWKNCKRQMGSTAQLSVNQSFTRCRVLSLTTVNCGADGWMTRLPAVELSQKNHKSSNRKCDWENHKKTPSRPEAQRDQITRAKEAED